jgi:tetratricopeptide (TPR) repeat protein
MSIFDKLFGKKNEDTNPAESLAEKADAETDMHCEANEKPIRAFDSYGREIFISRKDWREKVLIQNLQQVWNDPEKLYGIIMASLNEGFASDVLDAARQFRVIDPVPIRGACILGIVLMENNVLDEAEAIFTAFMKENGESGVILTNLAKLYSKRGNSLKSEETLWRALELDPNQENGLGWYERIHHERGGPAESQFALHRIAAIPSSWRAQAWLARTELEKRQIDKAMIYYTESLSRVKRPVPTDLLMQISGDLGRNGYLPELLTLTAPLFDPKTHGLQVGNNLIKAYLDLAQPDPAKDILDQLYAINHPDWRERLSFWDTQIARARLEPSTAKDPTSIQMRMLTIDGPVWLNRNSPAQELFPVRGHNGSLICFLGSSAEIATNENRIKHQLSDAAGRLSRALPLYFAEHIAFGSEAHVQTLIPWVASGANGFILNGVPWSDEDAAAFARKGENPADYIVTSHLKTQMDPWVFDLRLVRSIDAKCLGSLSIEIPPATPERVLPSLGDQLLDLIGAQTDTPRANVPDIYEIPTDHQFPHYLMALEQLLAVRCAAMDSVPKGFLSGEREIVNAGLMLSLAHPTSVNMRILLAQILSTMRRVRTDVLKEFQPKIALLQKEYPLNQPAQSVIQRMIDEAYSAKGV